MRSRAGNSAAKLACRSGPSMKKDAKRVSQRFRIVSIISGTAREVRLACHPGAIRVAALDFRRQIAFVKFIGTHAEYDRIDALTVSQF